MYRNLLLPFSDSPNKRLCLQEISNQMNSDSADKRDQTPAHLRKNRPDAEFNSGDSMIFCLYLLKLMLKSVEDYGIIGSSCRHSWSGIPLDYSHTPSNYAQLVLN